jgi:hypothetical protein
MMHFARCINSEHDGVPGVFLEWRGLGVASLDVPDVRPGTGVGVVDSVPELLKGPE